MPHAFLSPSSAHRWLRCHAAPWREKNLPNTAGKDAAEGTAAHFLLEQCLLQKLDAQNMMGMSIGIYADGASWWAEGVSITPLHKYPVDADMAHYVQKVLDRVRKLPGEVLAEQQLDISFITGEEGATGTADIVAIGEGEIAIDDLKYGRGVEVAAEENEQLLLYGAAALEEFDVLGEVEELCMRISQPRLNHFDEWILPVAEVRKKIIQIREIGDKILAGPEGLEATPGEKQCRFCAAKGTCEEARNMVLSAVADDFVDLEAGEVAVSMQDAERIISGAYGVEAKAVEFEPGDQFSFPGFYVKKPSIVPQLANAEERLTSSDDQHLATCLDAVGLIEGWCKAVRAEVERRLLAGTFTDARYKLVQGKRGARSWRDASEAEVILKGMRFKTDEMYNYTVKSPPQLEKIAAATYPRKWKKLQEHIMQSEGKPSVAPAADTRPALSIQVAEEFEVLEAETPALDDLI